MKIITAILLSFSLAFSGCMTGGKPDPALVKFVAQEAALIGTQVALQYNPQYRPAFETTRQALQAFVAAGSGDGNKLAIILQGNLPVSNLGTNSTVVLGNGGILLYNATGALIARIDRAEVVSTYAQPLAQGLLAGINQALGYPASKREPLKFESVMNEVTIYQ